MPSVARFAGMSARSFGWASASLSGPYFIGINVATGASNQSFFTDVILDNSGNATLLGGGNGSPATGAYYPYRATLDATGVTYAQSKYFNAVSAPPSYTQYGKGFLDGSGNLYVGTNLADGGYTRLAFPMKIDSSGALVASRYMAGPVNYAAMSAAMLAPNGSDIWFCGQNFGDCCGSAIQNAAFIASYTASLTGGIYANYQLSPYSSLKISAMVTDGTTTFAALSTDGYGNGTGVIALNSTLTSITAQIQLGYGAYSVALFDCIKIDPTNTYVYSAGGITTNGGQIFKFDKSLTLQWQKWLYNGTQNIHWNGMDIDSAGNVYVCGGGRYGFNSITTGWIAKYDSSGTLQWQRQITAIGSGTAFIFLAGLKVRGNSIWVSGCVRDSLGNAWYNGLVMRLPTDGSKTGGYSVGGFTITYAASSLTSGTSTYSSTNLGLTIGGPSSYGNSDAVGSLTAEPTSWSEIVI